MTIRPLLWFWLIGETLLWWALTGSFLLVLILMIAVRFLSVVLLTLISAHLSQAQPLTFRQYARLWVTETLTFIMFFSFLQLLPRKLFERNTPVANKHVILVHGFFCNAGLWFFLQRKLHRLGVSTSFVEMPRLFGSLNEFSALISDELHRIQRLAPNTKIYVIAFSMSDLAARLAKACESSPSFTLFTVNSPHKGTRLAIFSALLGSKNGQQMLPDSDFIQDLEACELRTGTDFISFWSSHDTIVVPAQSASAGDKTICYGANGHIYAAIDHRLHQALLLQMMDHC